MNIYRIVFTATVGQALIRAKSQAEAIKKLSLTPHGMDTADVKFQEWDEPELLDICKDDIEETMPDKSIFDRDEIRRAWPGGNTTVREALRDLVEQLEGIGIPDWNGAEGLDLTQAKAAIEAARED